MMDRKPLSGRHRPSLAEISPKPVESSDVMARSVPEAGKHVQPIVGRGSMAVLMRVFP
jgi:hypothetical protein